MRRCERRQLRRKRKSRLGKLSSDARSPTRALAPPSLLSKWREYASSRLISRKGGAAHRSAGEESGRGKKARSPEARKRRAPPLLICLSLSTPLRPLASPCLSPQGRALRTHLSQLAPEVVEGGFGLLESELLLATSRSGSSRELCRSQKK